MSIKRSCERCGTEKELSIIEGLQEKWGYQRGFDLCPDCMESFDEFNIQMDIVYDNAFEAWMEVK